jgi:hypothetical protein
VSGDERRLVRGVRFGFVRFRVAGGDDSRIVIPAIEENLDLDAALLGELDGVAQKVGHDLGEPGGIAEEDAVSPLVLQLQVQRF